MAFSEKLPVAHPCFVISKNKILSLPSRWQLRVLGVQEDSLGQFSHVHTFQITSQDTVVKARETHKRFVKVILLFW